MSSEQFTLNPVTITFVMLDGVFTTSQMGLKSLLFNSRKRNTIPSKKILNKFILKYAKNMSVSLLYPTVFNKRNNIYYTKIWFLQL